MTFYFPLPRSQRAGKCPQREPIGLLTEHWMALLVQLSQQVTSNHIHCKKDNLTNSNFKILNSLLVDGGKPFSKWIFPVLFGIGNLSDGKPSSDSHIYMIIYKTIAYLVLAAQYCMEYKSLFDKKATIVHLVIKDEFAFLTEP